jgi:hypothetical protein
MVIPPMPLASMVMGLPVELSSSCEPPSVIFSPLSAEANVTVPPPIASA